MGGPKRKFEKAAFSTAVLRMVAAIAEIHQPETIPRIRIIALGIPGGAAPGDGEGESFESSS